MPGICVEIIRTLGPRIPTMGVCLGHQCIGDRLRRHGVPGARAHARQDELIRHDGEGIYAGLGQAITATRYHSLAIKRYGFPADLKVTAVSADGEIMGVRHREYPIEGVQFHPESILTEQGKKLMNNFLYGGG